jgi:hypothetical protein
VEGDPAVGGTLATTRFTIRIAARWERKATLSS